MNREKKKLIALAMSREIKIAQLTTSQSPVRAHFLKKYKQTCFGLSALVRSSLSQ